MVLYVMGMGMGSGYVYGYWYGYGYACGMVCSSVSASAALVQLTPQILNGKPKARDNEPESQNPLNHAGQKMPQRQCTVDWPSHEFVPQDPSCARRLRGRVVCSRPKQYKPLSREQAASP